MKKNITLSHREQRVLDYIKEHGSITQRQAYSYPVCTTRLSSAIFTLRAKGYDIITTTKSQKNKYGERCTFASYSLNGGKRK